MRRRLLAAGVSGAAVSLLPWLSNRAGAQASTVPPNSGGDTTTTEPATTTTAPPNRPTPADIELLAFAQSIELTFRDLYDVALSAEVFEAASDSIDVTGVINAIRDAHAAYAQSISGLIGSQAPGTRNDELFDASKGDFNAPAPDVAQAAADLENVFVATHLDVLDALIGINAAGLIASILVVEARHATVLNTLAGATTLDQQLVSDGTALSPSDYPVK
jgi:hypothetical protein